jgi:hypothetical protein
LHLRKELLEKLVRDLLVQQETRAGNASLTLIVKDRKRRTGNRGVNCCILEDNVRALAAEFELNPLQIAGGA